MNAVTAVADLPLLASGKVRELYDLGDELLLVASDRISTYDAVHPTPIPGKGEILTGISARWFDLTRATVANHVLSFSPIRPRQASPDLVLHTSPMPVTKNATRPVPCQVVAVWS